MTTTIFTLFYDGSNWIALVDRHEEGMRFIGKHVFGVEPSNPELVVFVRDRYRDIRFHQVGTADIQMPQISGNPKRRDRDARRTQRELTGMNDALVLFTEARKTELESRKRSRAREKHRQHAKERLRKSQKKRQKRRGH